MAFFSHFYTFYSSFVTSLLPFSLPRSAFHTPPPPTTTITTKKSYFSRCLSLVTQDSVPAVKRITCLYSVCVSCVCVRTCMCSDVCINVSVCLSVGCAEEGERGESTHRGPSASTSIIPIHLLFPLTPPQNVKGNY